MEPNGAEKPHASPPSLWPVGFAVGVAVLLLGLVVGWHIVLLGAILTIAFGFLWVRDVVAGRPPELPVHAREPVTGPAAAPVSGDGPTAEAALPLADDEEVERYPRSKFLEGATLGLGGLIGGIVTVPALGFAVVPALLEDEEDRVDLGPLDLYPEGEWRVATFMKDPERGEVTRRTVFVRYNGELDGVPSFTILSNRCVHLGCPTQPNGPLGEDRKQEERTETTTVTLIPVQPAGFGCPCHGGQYDTEGNRTAGPPVRALDRFEFGVLGGHLWLLEPYSVSEVEGEGKDARIEKYKRYHPGEHVSGPEQILYPIPPP